MAAPARKARPIPHAPRRRTGPSLWETLSVFAIAGIIAYVALGYRATAADAAGEPPSPMALLPDHMRPVDHHFQGCNQARAMGMTDIPAWHPSYRPEMDGDNDGFACEPYYGP